METTWQDAARARLTTAWTEGDALKLWEILRNPDNTVSRAQVKALCSTAPKPRASIPTWRSFLATQFPTLEEQLAERSATRAATDQARRAQWEREALHTTATTGPLWKHRDTIYDTIYPHALAFVTALRALGYQPETTGIGTVRFRKDDSWIGPMRNKHINAAVTLTQPA